MADKGLQMLVAQATDCVTASTWETDWDTLAAFYGVGDHVPDRMGNAQHFKDKDYPSCVSYFFKHVYKESPSTLHSILTKLVGEPDEALHRSHPALARFLSEPPAGNALMVAALPALPATVRFLDVEKLPDDFYRELVAEVNQCYRVALYSAQLVLMRKLLENLVLDVLRRKYGTSQEDLYYRSNKRRFLEFASLIDNLEKKLGDFASVSPGLDSTAIQKLQVFRADGNRSAHTIDTHVPRTKIDGLQADAAFLVKLLAATFERLTPAP